MSLRKDRYTTVQIIDARKIFGAVRSEVRGQEGLFLIILSIARVRQRDP
jgi:hypothetical protein